MSTLTIFIVGSGVSLLCLLGLIFSVLEMKRLGEGGGSRALSMVIESERPLRPRSS
jgi:hypothetical protein